MDDCNQIQFVIPPQSKLAEGDYDACLRYPMEFEYEFDGEPLIKSNFDLFDKVWLHSCFESLGIYNSLSKSYAVEDVQVALNRSVMVSAELEGYDAAWKMFFGMALREGGNSALKEVADSLLKTFENEFPSAQFLFD